MSHPPSNSWEYDNGMMYDDDDENLDGIESLMNEQSEDDEDDDTNSRSDNDAEESSGDEDERDEAELLEDEENYRRFVHSVFFDDDARSANSFNDEDDEEYKPDEALDGDDEEDEDDERSNRRLDKVRTTELKGLVNECWQTIVGEAPVLPAMAVAGEEYDPVRASDNAIEDALSSPSKRRLQSPTKQRLKLSRPDETVETSDAAASTVVPGDTTTRPSSGPSAGGASFEDLDSPNKSIRTNTSAAKKGTGPNGSGQSVISSLVSQMFTGEKPFDVCIEGMPVEAIRKLVARQMSMATQLLMQILLLADEKSECFTTAYTSLMELSNLRDTALKKAKLIQMNMSNVAAIHSYNRDLQRQKRLRKEGHHDDSSVASSTTGYENEAVDNILALKTLRGGAGASSAVAGDISDSESITEGRPKPASAVVERRLTRSVMSAFTAANVRSTSVFDIPALTKVDSLFNLIDQARTELRQQKATSGEGNGDGVAPLSTSASTSSSADESRETQKRKSDSSTTSGPEDSSRQRMERLTLARPHISRIMVKSGMRVWNCLLPLRNYPLYESIVLKTDPTSLTGRSMFTPAEDDLLLRGIITVGENNWAKIKATFLPSKEAQLLQFRFSQMTSLTAAQDNNIFKRYQKLEMEYRNRDIKWSHEEDIDLLRGFQIFGERWPLIAIFFLPNRKRREIKQRWLQLQKVWQRGFQIHQVVRDGQPSEMTESMRQFLTEINFARRPDGQQNNESSGSNPSQPQSVSSQTSMGAPEAKVGMKRIYQNSAVAKFKAPVSSSVDMFLNQPAFGQYQYHYPPPPAGHPMHLQSQQLAQQHQPSSQRPYPFMGSGMEPRRFAGSPPAQVPPRAAPAASQPMQQIQASATVEADGQSFLGRFADSSTLMDFDLSSNFEAPQKVVDMTNAHPSVSAPATAPFAVGHARVGSSSITTPSVAPLSLGPYLLDNNRVPPSAPYVPVDYNIKRQQLAAALSSTAALTARPATLFSAAVGTAGTRNPAVSSSTSSVSEGIAAASQGNYNFDRSMAGDSLLSSPEAQSRDSVTKINILKTKPKKAKAAPAASVAAATPSTAPLSADTLDGFTLNGLNDDSIQIIPSGVGTNETTSASSKRPPKTKSVSIAKKSPTKAPSEKVSKAKGKKNKASAVVDLLSEDQTSALLQTNTDTISGLLHLPFDANATDSAWGLAALSRLPYDSAAVSSVFHNDQSTMATGTSASAPVPNSEIIHDDGLYSNLLQLGGLSNLLPLQSPSRPARPNATTAAAVTPGRRSSAVEDSLLFSPPTGRLGQATNIKRKLSTSKNLISSLSDQIAASSTSGVSSAGSGSGVEGANVTEVLSPSKKIKKGGLFASVMANVKK